MSIGFITCLFSRPVPNCNISAVDYAYNLEPLHELSFILDDASLFSKSSVTFHGACFRSFRTVMPTVIPGYSITISLSYRLIFAFAL